MKALFVTALLDAFVVLHVPSIAAAEPVLFLCGMRCASLPDCPREAFVVPMDREEDIRRAREIIRGPASGGSIVGVRVFGEADGTNKNYLALDVPAWNWHVTFSGFASFTPGDGPLTPSEMESAVAAGFYRDGQSWDSGNSTIMAELNPRFTASVRRASDGALTLEWDNLGLYYAFTVEWRTAGAESSWKSVPGISWPVRGTSHALPAEALFSQQAFLRVRADLVGPP